MKIPKYHRTGPLVLKIKLTTGRVITTFVIAGLAAACGVAIASPQGIEVRAQDQIQQHYNQVQPLFQPSGKSQLRQNLFEIEQAQINGVQTTSFECPNRGCSKSDPPMRVCPSVGAPIPVTDQASSPDQPLRENSDPLYNQGGNQTIGQMDPNGVYQGNGSGTYILCIGTNGAIIPSYWEGNVEVEFAPAVWDESSGTIKDTGPPSFKFSRSVQ